jgi:hypothetical protein
VGELQSLSALNITEISLDSTDVSVEQGGNTLTKQGTFTHSGADKEMFDADLAVGSGPVPADQSLIELLNNNDDVFNALEVGDSSSANSSLSIKVTIPNATLNGEFLVVLVN